ELIDKVWNGRIVSEAALSSRIKSARQAVGDDGQAQRIIRTVPKLGFRFVAPVQLLAGASVTTTEAAVEAPIQPLDAGRPSLAVVPFTPVGAVDETAAVLARAVPHELITELSRLRWLKVIARGSSFRFSASDLGAVRDVLGVGYCLSGEVEHLDRRAIVRVELTDTADQAIVWTERYTTALDELDQAGAAIVKAVIAALDLHIPLHEARQARLRAPENVDCWSAYHLGLNAMYRFSREGNAAAAALFERAIALDPGFARAHAGLSFTHFEAAFLDFSDDRQHAADQAHRFAEQALERDPLDPFCNLVMGRARWLGDDLEASLPWLDRALRLNPNYAQAWYARSWTETLMGQARNGQAGVAEALHLSPLDPMAYGMFGVRAFSHIVLDEPQAASEWAERAARSPGAHALIETIAAVSHTLAGDPERAGRWAKSARERSPGLSTERFFAAFPFRDAPTRRRIGQAMATLGL
ncbi:MAG: transcriptional regulator domain protein, partial [Caulobacteraceae bacterium]|nr:transcriptional regulator domain protein [Caulobacteraceae bacterium]